jgi:hypothetical protein
MQSLKLIAVRASILAMTLMALSGCVYHHGWWRPL